jgi:hypothetical protein
VEEMAHRVLGLRRPRAGGVHGFTIHPAHPEVARATRTASLTLVLRPGDADSSRSNGGPW